VKEPGAFDPEHARPSNIVEQNCAPEITRFSSPVLGNPNPSSEWETVWVSLGETPYQ